MKFRYKVLLINIILLSVGIGTVGFFMIEKNFKLALETQVINAVEENNLFQSAIEYRLIDAASGTAYNFTQSIPSVSDDVTSNMGASKSELFVLYDGELIYTNSDAQDLPDALWQNAEMGKKTYMIIGAGSNKYIYVSSCTTVLGADFNIINKRDISEVYTLADKQADYYRILLISVVSVCAAAMFLISIWLTKPLEKLGQVSRSFGEGDYSARSDVKSNDEIGELSQTYNDMACAIEAHVDSLNDMLVRKDRFVADFTHEIKTPMTSIIGYADTIRSKELSRENQILAASYIFSEGKRLEKMSAKLFDLIYLKQKDIEKAPFHTLRLAEETKESTGPSLSAKNQTLIINVSDAVIYGDILLLKSAFINLIDNAKKASEDGAVIELNGKAASCGGKKIYEFKLTDHGIGIDKEHLDKICDEFYMVDKSRSRSEGGAGLGLSLAQLIFSRHNADFDIESTIGTGTTITVAFAMPEEDKAYEQE